MTGLPGPGHFFVMSLAVVETPKNRSSGEPRLEVLVDLSFVCVGNAHRDAGGQQGTLNEK